MSQYYQVSLADDRRWHLDLVAVEPPIDIWACRRSDLSPPVEFALQVPGLKMDYNRSCFAIPVVSRRVGKLLESLSPSEIQRIPAVVDNDADNWEILNIVSRVDCIDHSRSSIQYYPQNHPENAGKPRGVLRLMIDPDRATGHHVFRVEDWEVFLVVSRQVKTELDKLGATGLEYIPVSD